MLNKHTKPKPSHHNHNKQKPKHHQQQQTATGKKALNIRKLASAHLENSNQGKSSPQKEEKEKEKEETNSPGPQPGPGRTSAIPEQDVRNVNDDNNKEHTTLVRPNRNPPVIPGTDDPTAEAGRLTPVDCDTDDSLYYHQERLLALGRARRNMGLAVYTAAGLREWEDWHVESVGFFAKEKMIEMAARLGIDDIDGDDLAG